MKKLKHSVPFLFIIFFLLILPKANAEHFTVTSSKEFLSKTNDLQTVKESSSSESSVICGPLFGSLIFIFSLVLLWQNEKGYVTTCHRLKEELHECAALDPYNLTMDHNGHLIYLKGSTSCDENLKDAEFPVVTSFNAIKLIRTVEMYQWKETHSQDDHHHNRYEYSQIWDSEFHSSESFNERSHINNSKDFIIRSEDAIAKEVHIGNYFLSEELKKMAKNKTDIPLREEITNNAGGKLLQEMTVLSKQFKIQDSYIYVTKDKFQNNLGDIRIRFYEVKCGPTTVVGQQDGTSFVKHLIESAQGEERLQNEDLCNNNRGCCDNCCGITCRLAKLITAPINEILWLFEKDIPTKEEVFREVTLEHQRKRNWIRLAGWVCSWLGIWIFFSPIVYLLSVIPLIGAVLSSLVSWAALLFGLIVGSAISVMVICLAWLFYRPLISLLIIAVSVGLCVGLCYV